MPRVRGQDAGATVSSGQVASSSTQQAKKRGRPKKDASAGKLIKTTSSNKQAKSKKSRKPRTFNLTVFRVARIITRLGNKRGSSLDSIRSKLKRDGHDFKNSQVRQAVARAIDEGLLREVKEERFFVPRVSGASSTANASAASPAATSSRASTASSKTKRRQRRPPQGRRRAPPSAETLPEESGQEEAGSAPQQAESSSEAAQTAMEVGAGLEAGEQMESKSAVTEPVFGSSVTGCDSVPVGNKVFGSL